MEEIDKLKDEFYKYRHLFMDAEDKALKQEFFEVMVDNAKAYIELKRKYI